MALETGLIFARKVLCSYSVIIKKSAIFRFSEWELFSKLRGNHKSRIKSSYAYDHLLWVFLCGDHPDLPQMMIIHGKQLGRKGNVWSQGREKRHHSYKREKSVKSNLARFPTHPSSEAVAGFGGFCWPRNGLLKRHAKIMWQSLICIEKCSPLEIFGGPQVFFWQFLCAADGWPQKCEICSSHSDGLDSFFPSSTHTVSSNLGVGDKISQFFNC